MRKLVDEVIPKSGLTYLSRILVRTRHEIRMDKNRISIISGRLRGLKLRYERDDSLVVSSFGSWLYVDEARAVTCRALLQLLIRHQMIT